MKFLVTVGVTTSKEKNSKESANYTEDITAQQYDTVGKDFVLNVNT